MTFPTCKFPNITTDQLTVTFIRQSRSEVTDLSYGAPDDEISTSTLYQAVVTSLAARLTQYIPASKQQDPSTHDRRNQSAQLEDW